MFIPAPALLAPVAWEVPTLHAIGWDEPATPDLSPAGWEEPVTPWQNMSRAGGELSVFNPIPFQPSFDTSSLASFYVGLPFPSGCLNSKQEDGPSIGLDFSGLHDPESMLKFLFACDELLSGSLNGYNTEEGGYDPTRECFHAGHEEHDGGNQLGMPRENDVPPPPAGEAGEPGGVQTPLESHMVHLEQLCEVHAKLGEEQQRLQ
jgi:hypothetical protein